MSQAALPKADPENTPPVSVTNPSFAGEPLFAETKRLFEYVNTHNYEALSQLCDDDFGIVDIDPAGKNVIVPDRPGWERWFQTLFGQLHDMQATTRTDILNYQVRLSPDMAYSVVQFCQYLKVQEQHLRFFCVATVIWKPTPAGWKEALWHCSLIEGPVPA